MDCDLTTFTNELLGKYGFTLGDWIYLTQKKTLEHMNEELFDLRDEIRRRKKLLEEIERDTLALKK